MIRIATIGVGTMAGPGLLFVLPYLLPTNQFASFAAVLAISQLIAGIGGFGLEVSCPRLGVERQWAAIYSFSAIMIASGLVFMGFGNPLDEKFVYGLLIAWASSLTSIIHSYAIFAGRAKLYGLIGLTKALVFLIVLVCSIYVGISPSLSWLISSLCGLSVAFALLKTDDSVALIRAADVSTPKWKDVARLSAPLAIIVAAGALPFVLDRAVAQQIMNQLEFARYAVAVTWAVPVLYIGNVIQQTMIATKKIDSIKTVCYWGCVIFSMGSIYFLLIALLSLYVVKVPYFANGRDFVHIWGWLVGWYVIYSTVSFPVAAVVQKYFSSTQLKSLTYVTSGILGIFLLAAYFLYVNYLPLLVIQNKTTIIILSTVFLAIVGVLPKLIFVSKYLCK